MTREEALAEAGEMLLRYRRHWPYCEVNQTDFCTCGMKQAADAMRAALALPAEAPAAEPSEYPKHWPREVRDACQDAAQQSPEDRSFFARTVKFLSDEYLQATDAAVRASTPTLSSSKTTRDETLTELELVHRIQDSANRIADSDTTVSNHSDARQILAWCEHLLNAILAAKSQKGGEV